MKTLRATRYVTPLREGGSLPAIIEAQDARLYVLKFRGAGQGPKALIAEVLAGELARAFGLAVPVQVLMELDPVLGRNEPDAEIRDLIKMSPGLNLGLEYLPGSLRYEPLANASVDGALASRVVWLDAFAMNVDRTAKNPNLLVWKKRLWLIDHGASFYFHHAWTTAKARSRDVFQAIKSHVLLPLADQLPQAHAELLPLITPALVEGLVALIPDAWLAPEPGFSTPGDLRQAYREWMLERADASPLFLEEALRARASLV